MQTISVYKILYVFLICIVIKIHGCALTRALFRRHGTILLRHNIAAILNINLDKDITRSETRPIILVMLLEYRNNRFTIRRKILIVRYNKTMMKMSLCCDTHSSYCSGLSSILSPL